jgi:hypothetical protein
MNEYLETKSTVARTLIRVVDIRYSTESIFGNTSLGHRELHYGGLVSEVGVCFYCICEEHPREVRVGIGHRTSTDEKLSTGSQD